MPELQAAVGGWGCHLYLFSPWPQNIGKSMSCQAFISNLNGLQDGGNFPKELLKVWLPHGPGSAQMSARGQGLFNGGTKALGGIC